MPTTQQAELGGDEDMDAIPPALLNGGGVVSMLALAYWMLATGRLYTGAQHREIVEDKDAQIDRLNNAVDVKDKQLERLAVVGEAVVKILASVEELAKRRQR